MPSLPILAANDVSGGMRVGAVPFGAAADYMNSVRRVASATGAAKRRLRKEASDKRIRMIAANSSDHPEPGDFDYSDLPPMPTKYAMEIEDVKKLPDGGKAFKRYQKFWGLPFPTEIKHLEVPGPKDKTIVLVGMGRSPEVQTSTAPKGKKGKKKVSKKNRIAAVDASGKRIWILNGKDSKAGRQDLQDIGYVPETHYIPTGPMEKAGTFKRGKYWVHKHDDDGGEWPTAKMDQAGNIIYDESTYYVDDWIRRNN